MIRIQSLIDFNTMLYKQHPILYHKVCGVSSVMLRSVNEVNTYIRNFFNGPRDYCVAGLWNLLIFYIVYKYKIIHFGKLRTILSMHIPQASNYNNFIRRKLTYGVTLDCNDYYQLSDNVAKELFAVNPAQELIKVPDNEIKDEIIRLVNKLCEDNERLNNQISDYNRLKTEIKALYISLKKIVSD